MRWWAEPTAAVFHSLGSAPTGLSTSEAVARREKVGPNEVPAGDRARPLVMLWRQLANPLVLVLVFAAVISALVGEWIDASVVTTIIVLSSLVGFWRALEREGPGGARRHTHQSERG
jgi:Mg2+-importing ATPase